MSSFALNNNTLLYSVGLLFTLLSVAFIISGSVLISKPEVGIDIDPEAQINEKKNGLGLLVSGCIIALIICLSAICLII